MSNKLLNEKQVSKKTCRTGGFSRDLSGIMPCNKLHRKPLLYKFVYSSRLSMLAVLMLLSSFLLQGVQTTYANEPEASEEVVPVEMEADETVVEEEIIEQDVTDSEVEIIEVADDSESLDSVETSSTENVGSEVIDEDNSEEQNTSDDEDETQDDVVEPSEPSDLDDSTNVDTQSPTFEDVDNSETIEDENQSTSTVDGSETVDNDNTVFEDANESTSTTTNEILEDEDSDLSTSTENVQDNPTSGGGNTAIPDSDSGELSTSTGTSTLPVEITDDLVEEQASTTSTSTQPAIIDNNDAVVIPAQPSDDESPDSENVVEYTDDDEDISDEADTATSSEPIEEVKETVINYSRPSNSNEYTFDKTACVALGNGQYHCGKNLNTIQSQGEQTFSSRGERGNLEIFIKTDSGVEQITDNYYDDSSPKYDPKSRTLVWQRLIDGRYHIITYNLEDEIETQITNGSQNHMEPTISGKYIVWQQWDGDDWEIILYEDGKQIQLTDNNDQDLAPVVEDLYVVWTTAGIDEQLVRVYSLESGAVQTIADHEGGAIVNPRFVLVYDTKFDNGDIITRGFDPETGLSSSLAATPAPEPIDIPPTDSTGETRALIQNKSPQREDFSEFDIDDIEPVDDITSSTQATSTSTSTSTSSLDDIVVVATTTENTNIEPLVLTEFDLVVTTPEDVPTTPSTSTEILSTSTQLVDSDEA